MAERNEQVFERVQKELEAKPELGSRDLYELARQMDDGIGNDSLQQFHARYVLPIKRQKSAARGGGAKRGGRRRRARAGEAGAGEASPRKGRRGRAADDNGSDRERVRGVFLEFARDFAAAESRSDIVQVLSRVDDYVERIVRN